VKTWILDGFMGNSRRFTKLRNRIRREVGPAEIWHYQTSGLTPIDYLGRVFRDILRWEGGPVQVVAYSMGGLITRSALVGTPMPVKKVVMLHVPHRGTLMAHLAPLPALRQMRIHSRFLKRLEHQEWEPPTLNLWCPGDLIVVPGTRSRWRASSTQRCNWVPAHIWPIYSSYWHDQIIEFLNSPNPVET